MGAATGRALARRGGYRVVLLDQFGIGHRRGSSHGASRIFRFSYHDPVYVRMAMEALPLWRELETELGAELLTATGGLDVGGRLDAHAAALTECGAAFELLDGAEVTARWPGLSVAREEKVLFQPDSGIVRADASVLSLMASATRHGAEVRAETPVRSLRHSNDRVEVDIGVATLGAEAVVVTAGAWARPLLSAAGIDLAVTPTRETVAYFGHDDPLSLPTLVDWSDPTALYVLASPGQGLKAGLHHAGPATDPDEEGSVDAATVARLAAGVRERYLRAAPEPHRAETCIYTNTTDESFVLERHGRIVVGSACSGHGFKFAPLVGERLADLAVEALES
jgi:sarcosine oxidase